MSDDRETIAAPADALQFDTAEFSERVAITCVNCKKQVDGRYWSFNGKNLCAPCREVVERHFRQAIGWRGWLRVFLRGGIAAALGTAIYFAVLKLTGYEVGLISIIVGVLVGGAVHQASGGRGGWKFQSVAIALTYASIVTAYVPTVFEQLQKMKPQLEASSAKASASDAGQPATAETAVPKPVPEKPKLQRPPGILGNPVVALFVFGAILFVLAALAPILAGFQNIIGWFIIGIALHRAWKINRRVVLSFAGPFDVTPPMPTPDETSTNEFATPPAE